VFPALAVARALRDQGVQIVWLGTREGIEARVVPAAGFELEIISIRGLRGGGLLRWLLLPVRLNIAMFQALRILRRHKPDAVLAGGLPLRRSLMASVLHTALIHEQNAVAYHNRWLVQIADIVMADFAVNATGCGSSATGAAGTVALPSPDRLAEHGRLRC
jgi:UDP-N-acetylglucosamine--N-acetylmuramyl-(pentapeptide) pyrophosphoryl-undecaprenol N-acetylglucosamine transferase